VVHPLTNMARELTGRSHLMAFVIRRLPLLLLLLLLTLVVEGPVT